MSTPLYLQRLLAFLIDTLVVLILFVFISYWYLLYLVADHTFEGVMRSIAEDSTRFYILIWFCVFSAFYNSVLLSTTQSTLGKIVFGIIVKGQNNNRLEINQIILRESIGKFLSHILFFGGSVWALVDQRQRTLQDYLAGSVVISGHMHKPSNYVVRWFLAVVLFAGIVLFEVAYYFYVPQALIGTPHLIEEYVVGHYKMVNAASMKSVLPEGSLMLANKLKPRLGLEFTRSAIVVYRETASNRVRIARVVGLPGETITVSEVGLLLNGQLLQEDYVIERWIPSPGSYFDTHRDITLSNKHYLILPDDRSVYSDVSDRDVIIASEDFIGEYLLCYAFCRI